MDTFLVCNLENSFPQLTPNILAAEGRMYIDILDRNTRL
jgi:hypothetical protein